MSEQKPLIYGIIHIGSSNLSLRIVEYKNVNEVRVIESVGRIRTLGKRYSIIRICLSLRSGSSAAC